MNEGEFALAQLRHAYQLALEGRIGSQEAFAKGLLGPAIERLERALGTAPPFPMGAPKVITHGNEEDLLKAATEAGHGPVVVGGDCLRGVIGGLKERACQWAFRAGLAEGQLSKEAREEGWKSLEKD
jgi:hypothetical protein